MARRNANHRRNNKRKDTLKFEQRFNRDRKNVADRIKLARFKDRKRDLQNQASLDE